MTNFNSVKQDEEVLERIVKNFKRSKKTNKNIPWKNCLLSLTKYPVILQVAIFCVTNEIAKNKERKAPNCWPIHLVFVRILT